MNDSADTHFIILRPALITPICIWLHVRYRRQTPQWILLWRDQYAMRDWRRLRRVANDINY
ncbi:hypothetical protein DQX04_01535 [Aliidiomarina sp. B3213]|nr:protein YgfX [Aliidiomarina sp. B3213]RTE87101.1 hypothetical protein DQX04_01535 [Aliidiomarina sp. B3213]